MHRLFVAIRPPPEIRDLLIDAMDDSPELRWQSDEQLHLTLRFIGEVDRATADDIAAALATLRAPAFSLRLSGPGCFDHRGGGALWAGVDPVAPVAALAAKVERGCQAAGCAPEHRAFKPHITIARFGRTQGRVARAFLDGRSLTSPPFAVDRFILFESRLLRHGAHYEAVADYPLVTG